jgi:putative spermidine/putrescine transport system permease protein
MKIEAEDSLNTASKFKRKNNDSKRSRIKLNTGVPLIFWIIAILVLIYLMIPVIIVVLTSLNSGTYLTFPPKGLSLRWIKYFFTAADFLPAYLLSLKLALITSLFSTLLGTLASIGLVRSNFKGVRLLQSLFLSPLILPGLVISMSLLIYYYSLQPMGILLVQTFTGILLAHIIITMPYVIRTVSSALTNFDISQEEAARNLGASPLKAFLKITLPQISSGISAGFLFALIVSFGAFDASIFLATPGTTPLPITIFTYTRWKFDPTPSAAGTFAILLVIVSMIITSKLTKLDRVVGFD